MLSFFFGTPEKPERAASGLAEDDLLRTTPGGNQYVRVELPGGTFTSVPSDNKMTVGDLCDRVGVRRAIFPRLGLKVNGKALDRRDTALPAIKASQKGDNPRLKLATVFAHTEDDRGNVIIAGENVTHSIEALLRAIEQDDEDMVEWTREECRAFDRVKKAAAKLAAMPSRTVSKSAIHESVIPNENGDLEVNGVILPAPALCEGEVEFQEQLACAMRVNGLPVPADGWTRMRFLRARGKDGARDIPKSIEMYQKSLQWRRAFGADGIGTVFKFPELRQVSELYQTGFFNTTKEGHPVYIKRLGKLDLEDLFAVTTKERLIRWHVATQEDLLNHKLVASSWHQKRRITQMFAILDLDGCSMSTLLDSKMHEFLGSTLTLDQDNYPEILYRMYIVNAPGMFSMAWSVISRFLDANTRAKISIESSAATEELLRYIDGDMLPDFLGGSASSADWPKVQPGPWLNWRPEKRRVSGPPRVVDPGEEWERGVRTKTYTRVLGGTDGLLRTVYRPRTSSSLHASGEVQEIPSCQEEDEADEFSQASGDPVPQKLITQVDLGDVVDTFYVCEVPKIHRIKSIDFIDSPVPGKEMLSDDEVLEKLDL